MSGRNRGLLNRFPKAEIKSILTEAERTMSEAAGPVTDFIAPQATSPDTKCDAAAPLCVNLIGFSISAIMSLFVKAEIPLPPATPVS